MQDLNDKTLIQTIELEDGSFVYLYNSDNSIYMRNSKQKSKNGFSKVSIYSLLDFLLRKISFIKLFQISNNYTDELIQNFHDKKIEHIYIKDKITDENKAFCKIIFNIPKIEYFEDFKPEISFQDLGKPTLKNKGQHLSFEKQDGLFMIDSIGNIFSEPNSSKKDNKLFIFCEEDNIEFAKSIANAYVSDFLLKASNDFMKKSEILKNMSKLTCF